MSDVELVNGYPKHPLLYEEACLESRRYFGKTFIFAGWEFLDTGLREDKHGTPSGQICCYKPLPNPEAPGVYLSYHNYTGLERRDYAAAWLIAHWYEHLLEICECLGAARSGFRQALISDLLYLQAPKPVL